MAGYRLSGQADADLLSITDYTYTTWGEAQALRYVDELQAACERLAASPGIGRACDELQPGLRRMEHGRHVIFYEAEPAGILVVRILHQRMLPSRHIEAEN